MKDTILLIICILLLTSVCGTLFVYATTPHLFN